MRRIYLLVILFLIFNLSLACMTLDWEFTLTIYNINVPDLGKLNSFYDNKISLILENNSITFKLPYSMDSKGNLHYTIYNPKTFNWENLVENDLLVLSNWSYINLTKDDISKISGLSNYGKNIYKCNNTWTALESNCHCVNNTILCYRCGSYNSENAISNEVNAFTIEDIKLVAIPFIVASILVFIFLILFKFIRTY